MSGRAPRLALLLVFFVSGGCALVYEVAWIRMFSVALGTSAYSLCAVLASFMAGLALGSWGGGKIADWSREHLGLYVLLEIGIAAFVVVSPWLINIIYYGVAPAVSNPEVSLFWRVAMRVGLCFFVLLIPTTLMGATLPILSRLFVLRDEEAGQSIALLYFVNTIGAAVGSFLAGFVLIQSIGIRQTLFSAAAVNILLAVAVLILRSIWRKEVAIAEPISAAEGAHPVPAAGISHRLLLMAVGFSGFAALGYEILWTRVLTFFVGWTVYSYSIMLTSFLFGLAAGSAIYGVVLRRFGRSPAVLFAWIQVAAGIAAMLSVPLFGALEPMISLFRERGWATTFEQRIALKFIESFLIMLPATILLGASLPAAVNVARRGLERTGRTVGSLFAVNTLGAILGSVASTFVILPLIGGAREGVLLLTSAQVIVGAYLLFKAESVLKSGRNRIAALPVLILALGAAWLFNPGSPTLTQSHIYRNIYKNPTILYNRQGVTTTATVVETGDRSFRRLLINNVEVGNSDPGDSYFEIMSYHGLLVHPDPKDVFVVGLATGRTSDAVLSLPEVKRLDTVEISGEVIGALTYFFGDQPRLMTDPRSRVIREDARIYLMGTEETYDVIISDVLLSSTTGTTHLLSREFFEICRGRLKPGGIMVIAISVYASPISQTIFKTFASTFPHLSVFRHGSGERALDTIYILGSDTPIEADPDTVRRRFAYPDVNRFFNIRGPRDPETFLAGRLPPGRVPGLAGEQGALVDDHPHLEFMLRMLDKRL